MAVCAYESDDTEYIIKVQMSLFFIFFGPDIQLSL